MIERVLFKMMS